MNTLNGLKIKSHDLNMSGVMLYQLNHKAPGSEMVGIEVLSCIQVFLMPILSMLKVISEAPLMLSVRMLQLSLPIILHQ